MPESMLFLNVLTDICLRMGWKAGFAYCVWSTDGYWVSIKRIENLLLNIKVILLTDNISSIWLTLK